MMRIWLRTDLYGPHMHFSIIASLATFSPSFCLSLRKQLFSEVVFERLNNFSIKNQIMKRILLVLSAMLLVLSLSAQKEETVFGKSGLRLTGAWGGSTTSFTAFDSDYAVLSGGFGGVEFNRFLFLGWGGYRLVDEVRFTDLNQQDFDLDYNGLILGFGSKSHKIVHPQVMLLTGAGKASLADQAGRDNVFVVQPSAGITVNVFRWFHLGLEGGYRFVNGTDLVGLSDNNLSAAFGQIRFMFGWSWGQW